MLVAFVIGFLVPITAILIYQAIKPKQSTAPWAPKKEKPKGKGKIVVMTEAREIEIEQKRDVDRGWD